jgi:peptidoglycan/xylan/chitin deacetylase (PgdA/CDA1 family)
MRAMSLAYHDVIPGSVAPKPDVRPGIALYRITQQRFQEHLRSIQKQGASIDVIRGYRQWQKQVPAFLTFDDGATNAFCAADELEKYGWRGHFFIATNWIGRPEFLNASQIRELHARGHVIGSHSCSHPERMSHLAWNDLCKEWSESCAILSGILGQAVRVASVPNGYYARNVAQAAAAAGLQVLFTSEATASATVIDGCLILGRYLMQWRTPAKTAGALAAGQLLPRCEHAALWTAKKALKGMMGESYLTIRRMSLSKLKLGAVSSVDRQSQQIHES